MEEVDFINGSCHRNKGKLQHILVVPRGSRTIPVGHIGGNVIHKLQDPSHPDIAGEKLAHFISKILVLFERKHKFIIAVCRSGVGSQCLQSLC